VMSLPGLSMMACGDGLWRKKTFIYVGFPAFSVCETKHSGLGRADRLILDYGGDSHG